MAATIDRRRWLARALAGAAGLAAAFAAVPVQADEDAERARRALEKGDIRPLDEVLRAARAAMPGDVVAVDLKRRNDRWEYRLRILDGGGRRRDVRIDAATLAVLDRDDDDED